MLQLFLLNFLLVFQNYCFSYSEAFNVIVEEPRELLVLGEQSVGGPV